MSITLDLKSKSMNLHCLPAKIDGDGEPNVEDYLNRICDYLNRICADIL
ncbi:hypothetical protein M5D96_008192 [Drosophila gunungcola]|uniref:Uncharacterized protein n=1 Tax=Drosophila gunungcola TaxID=103775 RepID=A0A9P9YM20_9MUSC|nr:hypothetical protein M5D96_008192 [Drosophila gunungcola]